MGVPQIWELLRPYLQYNRVSLKKFVSDFIAYNKRSPRIAIDGYTWIFECGFISNQESPSKYASYGTIGKAVLNFVHRLKELLALNIAFILVFDGNVKPSFKKKFGSDLNHSDDDYWTTLSLHTKSHEQYGHCINITSGNEDLPFMQVIKKILDGMHISYLEACGEGEAQCAWLQKNKFVDYVLTNDSDALVFGATKVLRNYSKFTHDLGATGTSPQGQQTYSRELFVTIVDLEHLSQITRERYNWWSLLFFSVLLGADYNHGVKGIGKVKAAKLAQLQEPDFALQFRDLFIDLMKKPKLSEYQTFQHKLTTFCRDNSVELFGRNYKTMLSEFSLEGWPSQNAIMYYFHPILMPHINSDIFDKGYVNISYSDAYKKIRFSELQAYLSTFHLPAVVCFEKWFAETMLESFVLRRLLNQNEELPNYIHIVDQRTLEVNGKWPLPNWKIKYKPFIQNFQNDTDTFIYSTWIPQGLIPQDHILIKKWRRTPKSKTPSPKKSKVLPQKNTLDEFLKKHSSPIKDFSPSKKAENHAILRPVKKRLFIDSNDSSNDSEDDSLVILEEITHSKTPILEHSSKKRHRT